MTYRLRVLMDQRVPAATCAGRRPTHTHPSSVWQAAHSAPCHGRWPSPTTAAGALSAAACYSATPEPRRTSRWSDGATGEAKRGAPVAAVAQRARVAIICTATGQIRAPDFRA